MRKKTLSPTVQDHLDHLIPRLAENKAVPQWPADVFALCSSLLLRSDSYCSVLCHWPPSKSKRKTKLEDWTESVETAGEEWRLSWSSGKVPTKVLEHWQTLLSASYVPINELKSSVKLCQSVLELCAIADEACVGVGIVDQPLINEAEFFFYDRADDLLGRHNQGSSVCDEIDPFKMRVLPKIRTPQTGLTIRSLSHNLALCNGNEIQPFWVVAVSEKTQEHGSLNLLVVPWPLRVSPIQFVQTKGLRTEMQNMPERFGFFTYQLQSHPQRVKSYVMKLYKEAASTVGRVHGVVLPEAAITPGEHTLLSSALLKEKAFLVAGVGERSRPGKRHGRNGVCIDYPGLETLNQAKHHRWRLNESQIRQYGLGGRLHPEKFWWEHIDLRERKFFFLSMRDWLTMCVLICEDLARPEPIGNLVRAVGPNLVIALLMDGPQLKDRWGARYAAALADDPGCSVLAVTSLGMCNLSRRTGGGSGRRRVVALWKDATGRGPTEIDLPEGCGGVVLSLTRRILEEWSSDGRSDRGGTMYPILSGIHPIKISSNRVKEEW